MRMSNASHGLEAAADELADPCPSAVPASASFSRSRAARTTPSSHAAGHDDGPAFVRQRRIGAVAFAVMNRAEAIQEVVHSVEAGTPRVFAFCNMHTFNLARRHPALAGALSRTTVFNDGIGIDLASRLIHGRPFPANLNGTDLTPAILEAFERPVRICLVGSRSGVARQAAETFERRYPKVRVVYIHDGFFGPAESEQLIDRLRRIRPDLVLIGMGNPRQEFWAIDAATRVDSTFLCVGAFLDFASGSIPRAPGLVRRFRGEWLYRLALEPRRLSGRYLVGGPLFMLDVLRQWLGLSVRRADALEGRGPSADPAGHGGTGWTAGKSKQGG